MVKRKKRLDANSHPRADSVSPNRPRLNPQERLLNRFYEPLVLLYTLGQTRGEHVRAVSHTRENLAHLPLTELRRTFLNELAYMCDYDKGGKTVTALGLQFTPQKHIFWVASNTGSTTKIIDFLHSLLTQIMHVSATPNTAEFTADLAYRCVNFAAPRIKKYRSHLRPLIRRCTAYLIKTNQVVELGFVEWLQTWEHEKSALDLCHSAHASRKSNFMRVLARLSAEPTYKSSKDAIYSAFGLIRHYIGRLGYHFRAADTLVSCAPRLMDLLQDFEVRGVPALAKSVMPPPDQLTRIDKVLVRMLPANSPDLEHYQQALTEMNSRYQVFHRFLDNYARSDRTPCIHAEIQVLEHFYAHRMQFSNNDPYIACSKPACFCCFLYFRNHPRHVVEPVSHNKIYLNWQPPDFTIQVGIIGQNHQRDILNAMNVDIRKEALRQLHERTAPNAWHPDSVTGITLSVRSEPAERPIEWSDAMSSVAAEAMVLEKLRRTPLAPKTVGAPLFQAMSEDGKAGRLEGTSGVDATNDTSQSSQSFLEELVSDSDEGGGVQLES